MNIVSVTQLLAHPDYGLATPTLNALVADANNYFRAKEQIALGAVEGLNNKANVTTKKAYGFKSFEVIKLALYHTLDDLPEPGVTHRFCE